MRLNDAAETYTLVYGSKLRTSRVLTIVLILVIIYRKEIKLINGLHFINYYKQQFIYVNDNSNKTEKWP